MDHACLNDIAPFCDINPSSENIARVLYEEMETSLAAFGVSLLKVSVWESDNAWASYFEG